MIWNSFHNLEKYIYKVSPDCESHNVVSIHTSQQNTFHNPDNHIYKASLLYEFLNVWVVTSHFNIYLERDHCVSNCFPQPGIGHWKTRFSFLAILATFVCIVPETSCNIIHEGNAGREDPCKCVNPEISVGTRTFPCWFSKEGLTEREGGKPTMADECIWTLEFSSPLT